MKHHEYDLQVEVCKYLNNNYPDVDFMSDTIANLKLTQSQAQRNKKIQKNGFKCPDILILEPRNNFSGLFIELKLQTPFKKDGTIKASANDHLKGQLETIKKLNVKGYKAFFSWSFDMTKQIIDDYLNQ
jgi:hypothetical protein